MNKTTPDDFLNYFDIYKKCRKTYLEPFNKEIEENLLKASRNIFIKSDVPNHYKNSGIADYYIICDLFKKNHPEEYLIWKMKQ